jgi:transposase
MLTLTSADMEDIMRKVELKMNEQERYEIIKELSDYGGNKARAALRLGRSRSTVYRMIKGYEKSGKEYFIHGNCGRSPVHSRNKEERKKIIELYNNKYRDASYALFSELLELEEGISASKSSVREILMSERILSPFARTKTRKALRLELNRELEKSKRKSERAEIEKKIVAVNEAHSRRPRSKYFGELLQMDASIHDWFAGGKATLHLAIDDATSRILGAWFCEQETLVGYYNVFYQILTQYGIPYMFFTDKRTVFEYKALERGSEERDTFTQFAYACKQLGVELKTSSVPQAKGRVERVFGTLQRRLPILFRTAGIISIEQANEFLGSYIKKHNAKFALSYDNIPSVFERQPNRNKINLILAVLSQRTVDAGHSISYENKLFRTMNNRGYQTHFRKGTTGLVIKAFDGNLFFAVDECVYSLEQIPTRERISKHLDITPISKPKRRYVPPMDHPWRTGNFVSFRRQQPHTKDEPTKPVA